MIHNLFFSIPPSFCLSAMFGPSSYNCAVCHHIRKTQNCNIAQDTTRRPAAQTTGALSASMGDVLPENAVQSLLKSVVPGFVVKRLDLVPGIQVRRVYNIESPNGDRVQLAFPPHPSVKLLRTERSPIRSEAATIEFLSQCCQKGEQAAKTQDPNIDDRHVNEDFNPSPRLKDPLLAFLPELIEACIPCSTKQRGNRVQPNPAHAWKSGNIIVTAPEHPRTRISQLPSRQSAAPNIHHLVSKQEIWCDERCASPAGSADKRQSRG